MIIQTLQHISFQELADCWNLAFADYIVPMQVSAEGLEANLLAEGVRMELSVGAFDGDTLMGFVLTGTGTADGALASYNAGTAVVPAHRGQRLTQRLYGHLLPLLRAERIKHCLLEVITENRRAVKVYDALGYARHRMLNCYKGNIAVAAQSDEFEISNLTGIDSAHWQSFWDWQPSWQNGMAAVSFAFPTLVVLGAFQEERLVGYAAYNPLRKRVHQFAVDKAFRRRGLGRQLFHHIAARHGGEMGVINVDNNSSSTHAFLQSIGLTHFLTQHEMTLRLD